MYAPKDIDLNDEGTAAVRGVRKTEVNAKLIQEALRNEATVLFI